MNIYQEALDSQSACNLSGVVRSLARMTEAIWDEARAKGEGTEYVNRHPVVIAMLSHCLYLATGDSIDYKVLGAALDTCAQRAAEK